VDDGFVLAGELLDTFEDNGRRIEAANSDDSMAAMLLMLRSRSDDGFGSTCDEIPHRPPRTQFLT
jgi:hypothetical protein